MRMSADQVIYEHSNMSTEHASFILRDTVSAFSYQSLTNHIHCPTTGSLFKHDSISATTLCHHHHQPAPAWSGSIMAGGGVSALHSLVHAACRIRGTF